MVTELTAQVLTCGTAVNERNLHVAEIQTAGISNLTADFPKKESKCVELHITLNRRHRESEVMLREEKVQGRPPSGGRRGKRPAADSHLGKASEDKNPDSRFR